VLLLTMHHIISDGWSLEILAYELGLTLQRLFSRSAIAAGRDESCSIGRLRSGGSGSGYREQCWSGNWNTGRSSWRVRDGVGVGDGLTASDGTEPSWSEPSVWVSEEVRAGLKELCAGKVMTLFMGLLAAFNVLLARYSGQSEFWWARRSLNQHGRN